MIRIFNRYLSIRDILYCVCENLLIVLFLAWGVASEQEQGHGIGQWSALILIPSIFQICLYAYDLHPSTPSLAFRAFWSKHLQSIFWAVLLLTLLFWNRPLFPPSDVNFGVRLAALPFLFLLLRWGYQFLCKGQKWETPVVLIGSGPRVDALKQVLSCQHSMRYRMTYFKNDLLSGDGWKNAQKHLVALIKKNKIRKVVIAFSDRRQQLPVSLLLSFRVQGIEVLDSVEFYEQLAEKIPVESLNPSHLIFGTGFKRSAVMQTSKTCMDMVYSVAGILLALPIGIILAILIKLDSEGPVLYRQERIGKNGRPFNLLKFRSMRQDAEGASGPVWASENDPRVTRVGRVMRTLRLDEIPQLLNVLRGEMSFVGPRPEREVFVQQLREKIPYYDLRLTVKPGLTGWAQVKYRYGATENDALEKLQYDLYYIKHLSPLFDLTIILDTLGVVISGRGAQ